MLFVLTFLLFSFLSILKSLSVVCIFLINQLKGLQFRVSLSLIRSVKSPVSKFFASGFDSKNLFFNILKFYIKIKIFYTLYSSNQTLTVLKELYINVLTPGFPE